MRYALTRIVLTVAMVFAAQIASSQQAQISFSTAAFDKTNPVEVTADALSVNQTDGSAVFEGNVLVIQGEVRMSAGRVTVEYTQDAGAPNGISRLLASGGVTFVTANDAVEARDATYSVAGATVRLTGDVLLTQGPNAISGDTLTVDLEAGTGTMEGRVRTVFNTGGGN